MKKNILIILNAIVYNRGSEALVRGLTTICKEYLDETYITLVSGEGNFGSWVNIENIDNYCKKLNYTNKSIMRYIVAVLKKLKLKGLATKLQYSKLKKVAQEQDIIIMVGADNYDIMYGMQENLKQLHEYIRKNTKAKMILYDCSIADRDITDTLKKDFKNFDIVTVRETISEENISNFVNRDKLYRFPDPAFVMSHEEVELPNIFNNKNGVVGINVSNLITNPKYGGKAEDILNAYINMMNYILENTSKSIVLIPHVMNNADLSTLKKLYENYVENDRVYLVENEKLNAKQLKYIISKCKLYVGARTHSTIAAYSTNVPTLVLGYSVKSKGISKDIFGIYDNYVLPVEDLNSDQYLVDGFKWLDENQDNIRDILNKNMPEYIERAKKVREILY